MQPIPVQSVQPVPVQPVPVQPVPVQPMAVPTQPVAMPMAVPVQPVPVQPMAVPTQPVAMPMAVPVDSAFTPLPPAVSVTPTPTFTQHLNVLNQFGGLFIKQKVEKLEAVTGIETENKYKVYLTGPDCKRGEDQKAYFEAKEKSDFCQRQCCGNMREFDMKIKAPDDSTVLLLHRPFKCQCFCFNLPEMEIKDASGSRIGTVKAEFACCDDKFQILDHNDKPVLMITGSCCQMGKYCTLPVGSCAEVTFDVINPVTNSTGYIKKVWSGFGKEVFTDADSFALSFPADATIYHKILLLAAVFLIDFMYFENNQDNSERRLSF